MPATICPESAAPVLRDAAGDASAPPLPTLPNEPLRVSDLTARPAFDGRSPDEPGALRPPGIVVTPALRGGPVAMRWYDWGVACLIVASLVAGVVCLLGGR
jgi:hypothetical protein